MENQRIRITKTMLKEALVRLLGEKSIEKITVYELCASAEINRTTFYKYYGSQIDLFNEITADFFDKIESQLPSEAEATDKTGGMISLLNYLVKEIEVFKALMSSAANEEFIDRVFNLPGVRSLLDKHILNSYAGREKDYMRLFFCHGGYAIIRSWLLDENREPSESIAEMLVSLGITMRGADEK